MRKKKGLSEIFFVTVPHGMFDTRFRYFGSSFLNDIDGLRDLSLSQINSLAFKTNRFNEE